LIKQRLHVAVDPSTLMRFYKKNGVKYYTLAYKYQQPFQDKSEKEEQVR